MIALVRGVIAAIVAAGVDVERVGLDVDEHRPGAERATTQPAVAKNE